MVSDGRARSARNRASEVYLSSDWITARVTNSASDSLGAIPTAGRSGTHSGCWINRSSTVTYTVVARVSRSGFIPGPPGSGKFFHPGILDTPTPKTVDYPPTPLGTTHLGEC